MTIRERYTKSSSGRWSAEWTPQEFCIRVDQTSPGGPIDPDRPHGRIVARFKNMRSLIDELEPVQTYQHPDGWLCDWEDAGIEDREELLASIRPHDPICHEFVFHDGNPDNLKRINVGIIDSGREISVVVPRLVDEALKAEAAIKGVPLDNVVRERLTS